MRFRFRRWPQAAILTICGCALLNLLFLMILPAARCIAVWPTRDMKRILQELTCWTAGVLPILLVIAVIVHTP